MIGLAEKKRQASAALTLTLEAVKFAVIVTVLLACMAYTDRDNRSYEMMYCADFVIAQALGAIIYSIRVSKMEKKESV